MLSCASTLALRARRGRFSSDQQERMFRFTISIVISLCVCPVFGAGMARVVDVVDGRTVVVDAGGSRSTVYLAGVVVPSEEDAVAVAYLRRAMSSGWVLVERDAKSGEAWLYRSPDGLFINGEMMRAAYRDGGTRMIWLGESSPGPRRETASPRASAPKPRPAARPRARVPRRIRR